MGLVSNPWLKSKNLVRSPIIICAFSRSTCSCTGRVCQPSDLGTRHGCATNGNYSIYELQRNFAPRLCASLRRSQRAAAHHHPAMHAGASPAACEGAIEALVVQLLCAFRNIGHCLLVAAGFANMKRMPPISCLVRSDPNVLLRHASHTLLPVHSSSACNFDHVPTGQKVFIRSLAVNAL